MAPTGFREVSNLGPRTATAATSTVVDRIRNNKNAPAPFKLNTEKRAEDRVKFEQLMRDKKMYAEEKKRFDDAVKAREEKEELLKERRARVLKAQPIHCPLPMVIKKSEKIVTKPTTPQVLRSISLRKNSKCGK